MSEGKTYTLTLTAQDITDLHDAALTCAVDNEVCIKQLRREGYTSSAENLRGMNARLAKLTELLREKLKQAD